MAMINRFVARSLLPRSAALAVSNVLGSKLALQTASRCLNVAVRNASNASKASGSSRGWPFSRFLSNGHGSKCGDYNPYIKNIYFEKAKKTATVRPDVKGNITYYGLDEKAHELTHHLHSSWTPDQLKGIRVEHVIPEKVVDKAAHYAIQTVRLLYDVLTGYKFGTRDEKCYLRRIVFLETVAGIPGMVGAMVRHFQSLRRMKRDYGWIHTLLEEAENERMHLMCAMLWIGKPTAIMRYAVAFTQVTFATFYTTAYLISPRFCHRFVGYIEEEAIKTYTGMIEDMEAGKLPKLEIPAHDTMKAYWSMPANSTALDVIYNIRADESHHREVNHVFAEMKPTDINPFKPGY